MLVATQMLAAGLVPAVALDTGSVTFAFADHEPGTNDPTYLHPSDSRVWINEEYPNIAFSANLALPVDGRPASPTRSTECPGRCRSCRPRVEIAYAPGRRGRQYLCSTRRSTCGAGSPQQSRAVLDARHARSGRRRLVRARTDRRRDVDSALRRPVRVQVRCRHHATRDLSRISSSPTVVGKSCRSLAATSSGTTASPRHAV